MPIIRSTEFNQQTAYDVQHCNINRVKYGGLHLEPVYVTVLYIISGLLVEFCAPDDGHNDARNMLS
jgi:hypothetical protein